jgi:hypothetical protein
MFNSVFLGTVCVFRKLYNERNGRVRHIGITSVLLNVWSFGAISMSCRWMWRTGFYCVLVCVFRVSLLVCPGCVQGCSWVCYWWNDVVHQFVPMLSAVWLNTGVNLVACLSCIYSIMSTLDAVYAVSLILICPWTSARMFKMFLGGRPPEFLLCRTVSCSCK